MSEFIFYLEKSENKRKPILPKLLETSLKSETYSIQYTEGFDLVTKDTDSFFICLNGFVSTTFDQSLPDGDSVDHLLDSLVALYQNNPSDFHTKIFGNFSLFLFDKNLEKYYFVRDSVGTRPLFILDLPKFVALSNDIEILLKAKLCKTSLNQKALIRYLDKRVNVGLETFYTPIKRFPRSTLGIFEKKTLSFEPYNHYSARVKSTTLKPLNSFKKKLRQAINNSITANDNLGLMLSGGLDSTAIALMLRHIGFNNVKTFSCNYKYLNKEKVALTDETTYQTLVASKTGYHHEFLSLADRSPIEAINKHLQTLKQPVHLPNIFLYEEIAGKCKADGVKTVIDGADGDNVVSHGFERFRELFQQLRLISFVKEISSYSSFNKVKFFKAFKFFLAHIVRYWGLKISRYNNNTILKDDVYLLHKKSREKSSHTVVDKHSTNLMSIAHSLAFEKKYIIFKSHGLHVRSPFYDVELSKFCVSLPSSWKLRHGQTRYILRQLLIKMGVEEIGNRRSKAFLGHGVTQNLLNHDVTKIKHSFENIHPIMSNLINKKKLQKYVDILETDNLLADSDMMNLLAYYTANKWLYDFGEYL